MASSSQTRYTSFAIPCPGALLEITGGGPIQGPPVFGPDAYMWLDAADGAATPGKAGGFDGFPAMTDVGGLSPCTGADPKAATPSLAALTFNEGLTCKTFEAGGGGTLGGTGEGPFKGNKG